MGRMLLRGMTESDIAGFVWKGRLIATLQLSVTVNSRMPKDVRILARMAAARCAVDVRSHPSCSVQHGHA